MRSSLRQLVPFRCMLTPTTLAELDPRTSVATSNAGNAVSLELNGDVAHVLSGLPAVPLHLGWRLLVPITSFSARLPRTP